MLLGRFRTLTQSHAIKPVMTLFSDYPVIEKVHADWRDIVFSAHSVRATEVGSKVKEYVAWRIPISRNSYFTEK